MIEETLGLLHSEELIDQADYLNLKELLHEEKDVSSLLNRFLGEVGSDIESKKAFLIKMCSRPKIRANFIPHLHHWVIKIHMAEVFSASLDDQDSMQLIEQEIKANETDISLMITNIHEGLLGEKISQEDLTSIKTILEIRAKDLFDELNPQEEEKEIQVEKEQVEKKIEEQENSVMDSNEKMIEAEIKNVQQYVEWLEEDISQMPNTIVDYQLRKIQIDMANKFIDEKQEPTQLPESFKQYLNDLDVSHPEGKKAKEKLLSSNEDIRRNLSILRECVCGIDIHDLFRMINKGRELQKEQQINLGGKKIKVILFLGLSKGGKTTILTRLMGYEMEKKKIEGIYTIQPKNPEKMKKQHKDLVIGYLPKSTTRYPRLFKIPQKFMKQGDQDDDQENDEYVTYGMDCAGFQDTAGIEVEISNRITTIQALKKVDKLQIAIVINKNHWGATGQDVEKLAKTTSSILMSFKQVKQSITFVFNEFDKDFKETFYAKVSALYKIILSQGKNIADENYKQFFKLLKEQTKVQNSIYTVDPVKLDPKQFLQHVSIDKVDIENAYSCLVSDIGNRAKQQIKKSCERFQKELKKCYSQGDMKGTQYFLSMLEKVGSQPKLESQANFQVAQIQKQLKEKLGTKIKQLRIQLEQFQGTTIRDNELKNKKINGLFQFMQNLKKDIQQFKQIQKSSKLQQELQAVIHEILRFYKTKMNQWSAENFGKIQELCETTMISVLIIQKFGSEKFKDQFNEILGNKMKQFHKKMKNQFTLLKKQHKMKINFQLYTHLQKSIKNQIDVPLVKQICSEYQSYKKDIKIIPLSQIQDQLAQLVITPLDQIQQIKNVEKFLRFIQIVSTYPNAMIEGLYKQMKKVTEFIVIRVPKNIMSQFTLLIKKTSEQQQDKEEDHNQSENSDKMKKIKTLIQSLRILDRISYIHQHYAGKLTEQFEGLEKIIEIQMRKFERIRDAFDQNDVKEVKKDISKLRSQFRQLQNMVTITQNAELIRSYQSLKDEFADSIGNFINANDIYEALNFANINCLRQTFVKYKKLKEFEDIYKILGNKLQLKQRFQNVLLRIKDSIRQPLKNHLNEIKAREIFQTNKLALYLNYIDIIKNQGKFSLPMDYIGQIAKLDTQTKDLIEKVFHNKICNSLNSLKQLLEENIAFGEQQIQKIQEFLTPENISNCRKSLNLVLEIVEKSNVRDALFNQIDFIWKNVNNSFEDFGFCLKDIIQVKQPPINMLDKLKIITMQLKSIQVSYEGKEQKIFDEINMFIRIKMKNLALSDHESKELLINAGPKQLEGQHFRDVYNKILEDRTETGTKNKRQLQQFFKQYRRKIQTEIEDRKLEMIDQDNIGLKIVGMIRILSKYHQNIQIITEKLGQNHAFKDMNRLPDEDSIVQFLGIKIISYFQDIRNGIKFRKKEESQKMVGKLKEIQTQIQRSKKYKCQLVEVEELKSANKVQFLSQLLIKQKNQRQNEIQSFKKGKNVLQKVNENYQQFYESLESQQQKQITNCIVNEAKQRLQILKAQQNQNFSMFKQKLKQLEKIICNLNPEGSDQIKNQIQQMKKQIEQNNQKQFKQIKSEQPTSMTSLINLGLKFQKSKNTEKLNALKYEMHEKCQQIMALPKQKFLGLLEKQFWSNKQKYQNLPSLKQVVDKIEIKLIDQINRLKQQKFKSFNIKYQDNPSSIIDSDSLSEEYQNRSYYKIQNRDSATNTIIEIYSAIYKGIKEDKIISQEGKNQCQKILNEISEFLGNKEKQCDETVKIFRQIILNPFSHEQKIDEVFRHIEIYKEDLSHIISSKNEIFRNLIKDMKFSSLQKAIKENKQKLFLRVNQILQMKFAFYSDQIKNNSDEQNQKIIQEYEQQLSFIKSLENPYNSYFQPKKYIRLLEIQKQIKQETKKAAILYEKSFEQFLNDQSDIVDPKLTFIPKIMKNILSTPRSFLTYCQEQQQKINQIPKKALAEQKEKAQKISKNLMQNKKNQGQHFQKFKQIQKEKLEQIKQKLNGQRITNINKENKQYQQRYNNEKSSEEKQKIKIQWDSKVKQIENTCDKLIQLQGQKYQQKLHKYVNSLGGQTDDLRDQFIKQIMKVKKFDSLPYIKTQANQHIDQCFKAISKDKKQLKKVFTTLQQTQSCIAANIVEDHQVFSQLKGQKFAQNTKETNSGEVILNQMRRKGDISEEQKDTLLALYNKFDKQHNDYLQKYTKYKDTQVANTLMLKISNQGEIFRRKHESNQRITDQQRVSLLAKIFALWSILVSVDDNEENEQIVIYYRAHAAQIICVLIVLCLDIRMQSQVIKLNRFAEVQTGQGKSIVLAGLSIYFALFGYEVHCACYSQMLSKRDEAQFEALFNCCKVKSQIHYGIFEKIIKKVLNQKEQGSEKERSFQNVIEDMITKQLPSSGLKGWLQDKLPFIKKFNNFFSNSLSSQKKSVKKVLIIDEIDVLFDKNYYGDTFNQSIDLQDPSIVKLYEFIWKNKANATPKMIESSNEFQSVINRYKPLKKILINQIHGMVAALSTYKDQNYTIIDKKIMYKVQDSLMDVSYRYNTVYAYLEQFQNNKISESAYNSHLTINLCVAEFSYAMLPEYYSHVVGVTGTLTCLPKYINEHLKTKYKVHSQQMFPIPSVYGFTTSNRKIMDSICTQRQKHNSQIIKSLSGEFNKGRPILIFFKNKNELVQFYTSQQFKQYQKYTSFVTEEHSDIERNQRIKNSSLKNTITLLTSSFIRGTDFKLLNKKAIELGGFHGIIAYLIDSPADYIQAKGRVARQGKPGTFIDIFTKDDLELLDLDKNDASAMSKIKNQRDIKQQKEKQPCEMKLITASKRHEQTIKVFQDKDFNQEKLIQYIALKNNFPVIFQAKKAKILLLVDATGSMTSLLAQLKQFLPQIFDDVYETLNKKKFPGCLQMQIVLYRNYGQAVNQLLEFSTLENQGDNLKKFISQARASGGYGAHQAVEVALQYVNTLKDVDEIILIGDAPGNTKQQVKQKRASFSNLQPQRMQKGFTPTCTQDQLKQLLRKNIKISGFYLIDYAKAYFEQLSKASNGIAQRIDVYNKQASSMMTQFIVERSLKLIGGSSNQGEALIAQYKNILNRRMGR